jgi:DNA-binding CsgD family transcriptional regulator
VTIKTLVSRGASNAAMARLLGVSEGTVRYHLERLATGAMDGRGMKTFKAASVAEAIEYWRQSGQDGAINLAALHAWLVAEHGYDGSLRSVQRFWARHYPAPVIRARRRVETPPGAQAQVDWAGFSQVVVSVPHTPNAASEWMRAILHKDINLDILHSEIGDVPELETLLQRLYDGRLSDRNRSMVVLATRRGLSSGRICDFLGIDRRTSRNYLRTYKKGGCAALFARRIKSTRKFSNEAIKQAVFGRLHEPPSNYGINRTTWIMPDLRRVLRETGYPVCPQVIRTITKAAGYRWRKARIVLTSSDQNYTEKLDRIRSILSGLRSDEAFFSIDEFGPFAVKMKPGIMLSAPGEQRVVPLWQKSKGCMIITAALELSGNQVTHFYSPKKNTAEMIRMMERLVQKYQDRRKLYLSWDAASWHISKGLYKRVEEHNATILEGGCGPRVETAPLPAGAQFLNVIESVFSGMARSIIHNSDYKTLDDAKAAIDRYFADRNAHFTLHPKRAGKKIWGKEREVPEFSLANNCKDPRYR